MELSEYDNEWVHGSTNVLLEGKFASVTEKGVCNVFGKQIITRGIAEWEVVIHFESFGGICFGLWREEMNKNQKLKDLPLKKSFSKFKNGYKQHPKANMRSFCM